MKGNKGVIISGGTIERDFALAFLQQYAGENGTTRNCGRDCEIIAADRGLVFCLEHGIIPDAVVGDFDSADSSLLERLSPFPQVEIRTFQPEKDWTDTELAVDLAIERGWTEAVLLGGTGTRLDHVLGNLQVMELAMRKGLTLILADSHNRIRMADHGFEIRKKDQTGHYVSLIPWGGPVEDLTLRGFHYEVTGVQLITGASRGISNEIDAETASITFSSGILLVVESCD